MLEAYAEQMQNKCRVSGSTVMVSSVDDLKSYSHDLALKGAHDEMETTQLFFFFLFPIVTYMGVTLRGCMSSFLHHRLAVNIPDQSPPLAKCCNGSC